ncbi:SpoIVB peptidase [Hydrogenispora ethanolica]|uniref:SpoIVB peptidase n=1 Tax=Hydrogenispora ethanolica TaxID=1082276 RepID=A0A4R1QTE1_HYDET|nr:SpoIVB peptidase [Hydrogenispora ethanolica]TCL57118.1 SpoIVB peptidase [Hydrogenispora ethanolica]
MKTGKKLKPIIIGCLVCVIGYLMVISYIQSTSFPKYIQISPGQKLNLPIHYPLSFHQKKTDHFRSGTIGHYDLQLKLLGAIPIKTFHVVVKKPLLVVPGGQSVGVLYSSRGVVVVGLVSLKNQEAKECSPARDAGLKPGDIILELDGKPVNVVEEVEEAIKKYQESQAKIVLTIKRNELVMHLPIRPVLAENPTGFSKKKYMLGILIEDPAAGVGTLSFYDPLSGRFAGLGHRISDFAGKKEIPFQNGEIVVANITGLKMGTPGRPGEKIGLFNINTSPIGKINKNTQFGIYGTLYPHFNHSQDQTTPVAYLSEIKKGAAEIYTVIQGTKVEKFEIEIIKVYPQDRPRDKGLIIKVTDKRLLNLTGGIIQGMSGSPIIQNGKLVGAVTHVFVNDPTKGYGVLAEWMVQEMSRKTKKMSKAS